MLLVRRKKSEFDQKLNMPAMVDIVFLLLIFFMCTSSLTHPEQSLASQMARPTSSRQKDNDSRAARIKVRAVSDGVLIELNKQICKDFESLYDNLRRRRETEDIRVIIEGQSNVPYRYMVAVLDTCYRANVTQVAFSPRNVN